MQPGLLLLFASALVGGEPLPLTCSYLYQPAFCMDHVLRGPAKSYCPQPGDLFLATDKEWWAKWGHWIAGTAAPQHSGIVVARPDGRLALLEAGPHNDVYVEVADLMPQLATYFAKERVWIRERCVPLTPDQNRRLTAFAMAVEGKPFACGRLVCQITPFRCRGPFRTEYLGKTHCANFDPDCPESSLRKKYFCSETVSETCVAAGLMDPETTRPGATYPRDLFFGQSRNVYINKHLDMTGWVPPARWTLCPGTEPYIRTRARSSIATRRNDLGQDPSPPPRNGEGEKAGGPLSCSPPRFGEGLGEGSLLSIPRLLLIDQEIGVCQRFQRAGVGPVARQDAVAQPALLQIVIVDVGDFQLAAPARLQRPDHLEDIRRIEIDAGDGIIALRVGRLLLDTDDLAIAELGHAVALRIGHLFERDPGPVRLLVGRARSPAANRERCYRPG